MGRKPYQIAGALLGVVACVAVLAAQPFPGLGFEPTAALGILILSICWWVVKILPEYVTALLMAVLFIVIAHVPTEVAFSAFSTSTWWLLVAAFGLGLGMQKSGLLRRIALGILKVFPRTFKAQAAGLIATGTLIGPLIPSLSAKAVMLAPLSRGISQSLGYQDKSREANGIFLAMFTGIRTIAPAVITASIIGPAIVGLLPEETQQQFDMVHWFLAALPWFLVVTVLNYLALVKLYGPRKSQERAAKATGPLELGEDLGPLSLHEKQMLAIIAVTIVLWIIEPLHGIETHVVALGALVATVLCGIFDKSDFRSFVAWESLIFIGVALGLATVFKYLGIDVWLVEQCAPVFNFVASNPYAFVLGVGTVTVLLRFLIVSEVAYVNIFMTFMLPLVTAFGINVWVLGFCVYALLNPWFVMYQNSIYLTAFYAVDGEMVRHGDMAKYCVPYTLFCFLGLVVSVPYWQLMGLL